VKPRQLPNAINLSANGTVAVAILSSQNFDALQVDPGSIRIRPAFVFFAEGAGVNLRGQGPDYACGAEDVNNDRRADLVCHFRTDSIGLLTLTTLVELEARTFGQPIFGVDSVVIVNF
jgi:hypothetical protein